MPESSQLVFHDTPGQIGDLESALSTSDVFRPGS
jgi:hypothetical protein